MIRTQHPSNNKVLGAPVGWNQGELPCNALPITCTEVNGMPAMVSYWTPTEEERAQIAAGGMLALWVIGSIHPPVAIEVEP